MAPSADWFTADTPALPAPNLETTSRNAVRAEEMHRVEVSSAGNSPADADITPTVLAPMSSGEPPAVGPAEIPTAIGSDIAGEMRHQDAPAPEGVAELATTSTPMNPCIAATTTPVRSRGRGRGSGGRKLRLPGAAAVRLPSTGAVLAPLLSAGRSKTMDGLGVVPKAGRGGRGAGSVAQTAPRRL